MYYEDMKNYSFHNLRIEGGKSSTITRHNVHTLASEQYKIIDTQRGMSKNTIRK